MRIPTRLPDLSHNAAGVHAQWYAANVSFGVVTAQRCACGVWLMPSRVRCGSCGGGDLQFEPISQSGEVVSYTVTHRPLHGGFAASVPYAILIVRTAEGVKLLVACDGEFDGDRCPSMVSLATSSFGVPYAYLSGASIQADGQDPSTS